MGSQSWLFIKATWDGDRAFSVENSQGSRISLEIRGRGINNRDSFAPVEAFVASLGCCAGTNVVMMLREEGIIPVSFIVKAECLLNNDTQRSIGKIHLNFLFTGIIEENVLESVIHSAMTLICPIAVTVGKATEVTWDQTVSRPHG
jgi:uncharacterized OsmC-like protein